MNENWINVSTIPGFSEYDKYLVSDRGRVKSLRYKKIMSLSQRIGNGEKPYNRVGLVANRVRKHMSINRLVLLAFKYVENHSELQADHIDENTLNDKLDNLQWLTPTENKKKSAIYTRIFSEKINETIIEEYKAGAIYSDLAKKYNCSIETIFRIVNEFNGENGRKRTKFTLDEITKLKVDKKSYSLRALAKKYNCSVGYIQKVLNG